MIGARPRARVLPRSRSSLVLGALAVLTGCAASVHQTPEDLRSAWRSSIEKGDAHAAWALLSPAAQRGLDEATFVAAFERDLGALRADGTASDAIRDRDAVHAWTATTVHDGGVRLRWAKASGRWMVTSGLPGLVDERDVVAVIRAFVADLRALPTMAGLRWVTAELADATRAALETRASAIEAALAEPDALTVNDDESRASLRYGDGRQLLLVRGDGAWRVTRIE